MTLLNDTHRSSFEKDLWEEMSKNSFPPWIISAVLQHSFYSELMNCSHISETLEIYERVGNAWIAPGDRRALLFCIRFLNTFYRSQISIPPNDLGSRARKYLNELESSPLKL